MTTTDNTAYANYFRTDECGIFTLTPNPRNNELIGTRTVESEVKGGGGLVLGRVITFKDQDGLLHNPAGPAVVQEKVEEETGETLTTHEEYYIHGEKVSPFDEVEDYYQYRLHNKGMAKRLVCLSVRVEDFIK